MLWTESETEGRKKLKVFLVQLQRVLGEKVLTNLVLQIVIQKAAIFCEKSFFIPKGQKLKLALILNSCGGTS